MLLRPPCLLLVISFDLTIYPSIYPSWILVVVHTALASSQFSRGIWGKYSWDAILKNTNLMKRKWIGKWAAISKTISRILLCVLLFLNFWGPLVRWLLYESLRICQSLKQSLKCLSFQDKFFSQELIHGQIIIYQ